MNSIALVWRTMLLKASPEDFPPSQNLLIGFCLLMMSMGIAASLAAGVDEVDWPQVLIDLLFLLAFFRVVLSVFRMPQRYKQTVIAIVGCRALFSGIFIPLNYIAAQVIGFGEMAQGDAQDSAFSTVLALVYLAFFIWLLRVFGHILVSALEVRLSVAIVISLLYMMGSLFVSLLVS